MAESSDVHGVLADTEGFASTADGPSSTANHEPGNELRKPITPEVLIAVVRKVFSCSRFAVSHPTVCPLKTTCQSAPLSGLEQRYVTAHATLPSYSVDVVEFTTN